MKVYTIIVTYNGMKWIQKALASISTQSEVIVIDNGSSDNTVSYVKDQFPEIEIVVQKENLGFGQANNLGISLALRAGATHLFLMNQDVYVNPNTISILINASESKTISGIFSPLHKDGKGEQLDFSFSKYISSNPELLLDYTQDVYTQTTYAVHFVNAAAWFFSRDVVQTVGGFDPIFFHYGEDDNFIQRLHYQNFKVYVVPKAIIYHDRQGRINTPPALFSKQYYKNWEKHLKVSFANPNKKCNLHKRAAAEINKITRKSMKSLVRLDWRSSIKFWSMRKKVKPLFKEIADSREKSRTEKGLYL